MQGPPDDAQNPPMTDGARALEVDYRALEVGIAERLGDEAGARNARARASYGSIGLPVTADSPQV